MQHLFVVTYGRSGSTLVQRVLNAIDGFCIRGENGGLIAPIVQSDRTLRSHRGNPDLFNWDSPSSPWYGISQVDPDQWRAERAEAFTRTILAPAPGTRVTGFKEVRYTPEDMDYPTFMDTMEFLLDGFKQARVVFNTRDAAAVARSGWWREMDAGQVREYVATCDRRFGEAHERFGPERCFRIDYSEYDGKPEGFRPLLDWLGESVAPEALAAVCAERLEHLQDDRSEPGSRTWVSRALNQLERRLGG